MDRGVDPFTFEIIRHKLFRVVDEAVATLELVSGTPSTAEGHDLIVALYTPEGGLLTAGLGFVNHVAGAAQSVKHILANYSEDPGIFEDDVFLFNDPFSGPMHPPDINMISPIHWEGKLAGWVANFVHATDIGGIDPGGFCPSARECYHEGFSSPGIKIVERGKLRKDVQNTILNMVRAPGMMLLDMKSQMAANYVAKQRMQKLYREYGYETVDAVGRELIRQSEQLMRQRLLELPDGQWRARHYYDLVDLGKLFRVELVATKERDTLTFDFSGSSEQAPIGINCSYWSTWGSVTGPAFTLLGWDMTWNEGLIKPFKLIAPPGTVINAHKPAPISIATIGIVYNVFHAATTVIAKMLGASEKYQKRPTGVWHGASLVWSTSGLSQWGDYMVHIGTEAFGGGAGARAFKDGVDMGGGAVVALVTRWTNAEMIELNAPLLYLYRRLVPDSAGPGKYRGGMCPEWAATLHDCPNNELKLVLMPGKGSECPPSYGVFGGYPGCNSEFIEFRGSNATEFPNELAATAGRAEHMQWGV
ncbi:MAG: hydantoinase B/oxoprolinase family protein, partial [Dehalococcoidia bacterium]|nr:hydantoinase B/oxoprolinase family protein [Dehalococcoidia bacterium]